MDSYVRAQKLRPQLSCHYCHSFTRSQRARESWTNCSCKVLNSHLSTHLVNSSSTPPSALHPTPQSHLKPNPFIAPLSLSPGVLAALIISPSLLFIHLSFPPSPTPSTRTTPISEPAIQPELPASPVATVQGFDSIVSSSVLESHHSHSSVLACPPSSDSSSPNPEGSSPPVLRPDHRLVLPITAPVSAGPQRPTSTTLRLV